MKTTEELMQDIERESRERSRTLREMLYREGRPDLVDEYDKSMKDLALGITTAKNIWHSISEAQRRTLEIVEPNGVLRRLGRGGYGVGEWNGLRVCGASTARNLIARDLLAVDGGVFDPECKLVLTEHARFVLKHGRH